jgi:hypothetical protein
MTVTFEVHDAEEMKLIANLLSQLDKLGVPVHVVKPKTTAKKAKRPEPGIAKKLHSIVKLPEGFDYKIFIADEILSRHG